MDILFLRKSTNVDTRWLKPVQLDYIISDHNFVFYSFQEDQ